jgi:hypothetical protein
MVSNSLHGASRPLHCNKIDNPTCINISLANVIGRPSRANRLRWFLAVRLWGSHAGGSTPETEAWGRSSGGEGTTPMARNQNVAKLSCISFLEINFAASVES